MVAWEGWKDRYDGQAGCSGYGFPPDPPPKVGGWEAW